jgi:hypothetical protein
MDPDDRSRVHYDRRLPLPLHSRGSPIVLPHGTAQRVRVRALASRICAASPGIQCASSVEVARHLVLGSALLFAAAISAAISGCSITSTSVSAGGRGLSCKLGGGCSQTRPCMSIEGCTSNCNCLDGTWQAPCPTNLPETGSACTPEGAECGYSNVANACGADNCYCEGGAWSCGPTCAIEASTDGGFDGGTEASGPAACVASGGKCVQGVAFCANVGPGATPKSCLDLGPTMLCCAANADAGCTEIQASSYDQSCQSDSDCVTVNVGNACAECTFACGTNVGAISVGAMSQYVVDVDKTPAGAADCGCPAEQIISPCCRGGQCHADNACALDGSTAAADTGAE